MKVFKPIDEIQIKCLVWLNKIVIKEKRLAVRFTHSLIYRADSNPALEGEVPTAVLEKDTKGASDRTAAEGCAWKQLQKRAMGGGLVYMGRGAG